MLLGCQHQGALTAHWLEWEREGRGELKLREYLNGEKHPTGLSQQTHAVNVKGPEREAVGGTNTLLALPLHPLFSCQCLPLTEPNRKPEGKGLYWCGLCASDSQVTEQSEIKIKQHTEGLWSHALGRGTQCQCVGKKDKTRKAQCVGDQCFPRRKSSTSQAWAQWQVQVSRLKVPQPVNQE